MAAALLSVRDFYDGKNVFVTGATGFAGKSLVQRLLDTVSVNKVFVLMRGKKGKSFEERYKAYKDDECFSYYAADKIDKLKEKIVAIEGDISFPRLGLADQDYQALVENVHVVFHAAASVRFAEAYKTALRLHIFGTHQIIQLCRDMKQFDVLVHLSSISCWFVRDRISERIYMSGQDPLKLWKDVEHMSEAQAEEEGKDYIGAYPKYANSYFFTKTMTEVLLNNYAKDLKTVCARLPFIGSAYKRPTPGWFETVQTINAIIICLATGTMRQLGFEPDTKPEFLPVDYCSNALITSAVEVAQGDAPITVYNVTPKPSEIPVIYDATQVAYRLGKECPSIKQLLPPIQPQRRKPSYVEFYARMYLTYVFAMLVDLSLFVCGQKAFFFKLSRKINTEAASISIELHKTRIMPDVANMPKLYERLSPEEQHIFYYDPKKIDWSQVLNTMYMRFRRKLLKEPDTNIPQAVARMKRLQMIYSTIAFALRLLVLYSLYCLLFDYIF